jgi:hypothetical protein
VALAPVPARNRPDWRNQVFQPKGKEKKKQERCFLKRYSAQVKQAVRGDCQNWGVAPSFLGPICYIRETSESLLRVVQQRLRRPFPLHQSTSVLLILRHLRPFALSHQPWPNSFEPRSLVVTGLRTSSPRTTSQLCPRIRRSSSGLSTFLIRLNPLWRVS